MKNKKRINSRRLNLLLNVVLIFQLILLIMLLFYFYLGIYNPIIFIKSDSMEPTILKGDVVLIKKIDFGKMDGEEFDLNSGNKIALDLKNQTIAYFNPYENRIIVHRVVEVTNEGLYLTKGDNNLYYDFFLFDKKQVLGKVILVI